MPRIDLSKTTQERHDRAMSRAMKKLKKRTPEEWAESKRKLEALLAEKAALGPIVADRSMCWSIKLDKAFENAFCITAILRLLTKNPFSESFQRLIQLRRVLWGRTLNLSGGNLQWHVILLLLSWQRANPAAAVV